MELVFGRKVEFPYQENVQVSLPVVKEHKKYLRIIRDIAAKALAKKQAKVKERIDATRRVINYSPGDLVLVFYPNTKKHLASKLMRKFQGPYQILEVRPKNVYLVQKLSGNRQVIKVNVKRLKRFYDRTKIVT
jgi:hypothetical protein